MNKDKIPSDKIFVVRPSTVVYDDTKYGFTDSMIKAISAKTPIQRNRLEKAKASNVNNVTHTASFENRIENITIAIEETGICKDLITDEIIYDSFISHFCEGEKCVNVVKNDKILLARYLFEKNLENSKYTSELEKYILSLKPFYTIEEIKIILEEIKKEVSLEENETKIFTLKQKSKQPIFSSFI